MGFLIFVATVAVAVWLAVIAARLRPERSQFSFPLFCFAILLVGSVLGFEFFHIDKGPIPITIDRLLLLAIIATFGCLCLRRREAIRFPDSSDALIGALMLLLAASAVMSDWSYANNRPLSRLMFYYMMPVGLYFVVKNARMRDFDLKLIAVGFSIFGLYLALTAIAENRGWYSVVFPSYIGNENFTEFFGRGRGPFLNPVGNGFYLTTCLAAVIVLWWNSKRIGKTMLTIAIPILLAGAIVTLTRSVWLGLVVAVGLVVWIPASRRQRAALVLASVSVGFLIFFAVGQSVVNFKRDKYVSVQQMSESAQLRPIFAAVAWEMFQDRPIFGCGLGQYGRARLDYIHEPNTPYQLRKARSYYQHNVFLSFLTETGLIGCLFLVLLLTKMYLVSWSLWRNRLASTWARSYALVMIATITAYILNGIFHDVSIIPMANMLLLFMFGVVGNLHASCALDHGEVRYCGDDTNLNSLVSDSFAPA